MVWSKYVTNKCPDPPKHPDEWPNKNHGHRPTCEYVWSNCAQLQAENKDSAFDAILETAIEKYKATGQTRGQVPTTAAKLRDSLEKNGLTEEKLKDWPSPEAVRGPYVRKQMLQAAGLVVTAIIIL